ncbi:MAG: chemotaxis response regulator protein-glutamate methylesterase [Deltaproteobacteria bacterium]|nr:chemotaxis response regulator protein-glutamate methylesterase [Deltaproteobacteria bacterium]MBW2417235.1 chemotaxis response regulator protein-glutamate methylesterase [Deltaproteobacteria bacterium]
MSSRRLIRVLVIDDSAFSRRTITRMLETSPLVEVVDVARDGEEALRKTLELKPDLVTLDLEMPRMDGFTFLRLVMAKLPTPVMVISGRAGEEDTFKALDLGAVDFIGKPTRRATPALQTIQEELIRKVHAIRDLRIDKVKERIVAAPRVLERREPALVPDPSRVVVIGSSTGGPAALMQTFGAWTEAPACAFLVAQHMPEGFTRGFAERLDRLTPFEVAEARGGEDLRPGRVLIAPGGHHLELESRGGRVVTRVVPSQAGDKYTPSVDRLFSSAAKHIGSDLLAVVLTGMGDDGRMGAGEVRESGGKVIAESEETAVIFGMPQQAIRAGHVDEVLPLNEVPAAIQAGMRRNPAKRSVRGGAT